MFITDRQLILNGDHYLVPLAKGARSGYAIIDIVDHDIIAKYNWYLNNFGYAVTNEDRSGQRGHKLFIHRLIMPDGGEVDHINGNPLDCRRANLRYVTHQQNTLNTPLRKDSTTGYKGVSWNKGTKKFHAYITHLGKRENIGHFSSLEEAVEARKVRENDLHGSYARA